MKNVLMPQKIGNLEPVSKTHWGKTLLRQWYRKHDGEEYDFYMLDYKGGTIVSLVLPITLENDIVGIRQFREGADEVIIEIPGGNPHGDQLPLQVAQKELLEECGFEAEYWIQLSPVQTWFEPATYRNQRYFAYLATGCKKVSEPTPDRTENISLDLIPAQKWVNMIFSGEIHDAKTIAVTFMALPYLDITLPRK